MKIRKNLIIPFAAIVILGLYLAFNTTGKMNYKIPEFNYIESKTIDKIEITGEKGKLNLYSENGVWKFDPDNYRADPSKMTKVLSFLENPQFIDMVSNSKNYQNYGLQEGKFIHIKARIVGNSSTHPNRELLIGDQNQNGNFAFIRTPDNTAVFTVQANIRTLFDVNQNDLLDKQIFHMDTSKIDKIDLISDDQKTTINKTVDSDNKDIWKSENGLDLDTTTIDQSLRYLGNSRFESYSLERSVNNDKNLFMVNLYEEGIIHSLSILKKNEKNYSALSSFTVEEFILSENTGTQIMKMFGDTLKL